ncbi:hypothetical protein Herbaro_05955 [Herbaspirillum sp. WKF16]|uniref:hypothetical protein n=1 Tax=Herbaspirillum sp. WKF16 TaxID=3028312 RepID=UPI0023A94279|nr:hypothetical protein [Herbaspirillum sp. WKF16]WDZ97331.1 hypothetical protein Herbaro_05955 [Herbaspirillum sp. WKF16]
MAAPTDIAVKAVQRLFGYAALHAQHLQTYREGDELKFHLDHFLLTITAAVQNIISLVPKLYSGSMLTTPRAETLRINPTLQVVCWAWHARNHVAHNYLTLVWSQEAEMTFGDGFAAINGSALNATLVVELQPVEDEQGNTIHAPKLQPHEVAEECLSFWEATFNYVLMTPKSGRYTYQELAAHWQAN